MTTFIEFCSCSFLFLMALASSGMTYQYVGSHIDEKKYIPIGRMVDIGGYQLHMVDMGSGGPTVVIDSGLGCNCLDWQLVQPEIAKFTRVITYDRAGYAWSDPSPLSRTSENIVFELYTLLHQAGIPGPYVLVGHSFGGNNMRLYADIYPEDVLGIVLVDAGHEDFFDHDLIPSITDYIIKTLMVVHYVGIPRLLNNIPPLKKLFHRRLEDYSQEMAQLYFAQKSANKYAEALGNESLLFKHNCTQLKGRGSFLQDKPLIVISAAQQFLNEEFKGLWTDEEIDRVNKRWPELQMDLVTKSYQSRHLIAHKSGHMINYDEPEIIVQAVYDMIFDMLAWDGNID